MERVPHPADLRDSSDGQGAPATAALLIDRDDAPLCFAEEALPLEGIIPHALASVEIDISAADVMLATQQILAPFAIEIDPVRSRQHRCRHLSRAGRVEPVGAEPVFPARPTAEAAIHARPRTADAGHGAALVPLWWPLRLRGRISAPRRDRLNATHRSR